MTERLYEMTGRLLALADLLDDPEVPDEAVRDTIEAIEGEIEIKAEGILKFVANIDSDVKAVDTEIRRLQARKKILQNRQGRLREYLRHNMEVAGISRIECSLFLISLAKGRAIAQVNDAEAIPAKYKSTRTEVLIDKASLLRDLKNLEDDQEIPGASLGTSKPSLRIK